MLSYKTNVPQVEKTTNKKGEDGYVSHDRNKQCRTYVQNKKQNYIYPHQHLGYKHNSI